MGGTPRLQNKITGERPLVLHANGHTGRWFMSALWRELRVLKLLGLGKEDLAHLCFDGPVAPGTWPALELERKWNATFQIYKFMEFQQECARRGEPIPGWSRSDELCGRRTKD